MKKFNIDKFVQEKKKMRPTKEIVKAAKERLGEKGYHILYNNCEHFVWQCALGEKVCTQVDEVREMWKKFPFVNVYVEKYPFKTKNDDILPKKRLEEINSCRNENVKNEKYYDWKLLEQGIKHSLGLDMKEVSFDKKGTKWVCDNFEFSLSHSGDLVAVVVARNAAGIDVEEKNIERFAQLPQERILTQNEIDKLDLDSEGLNKLWTAKEAIFKRGENKSFNPSKVDTTEEKFVTKTISVEGKEYFLTVATNDLSFVKYHFGEDIKMEN